MRRPVEGDSAPVWQAWVAAGRDREERLRRYAAVPEALQARVASHMRTVQAIEAWHAKPRERARRDSSRKVQNAHRRVDRNNPYGGADA